MGTRHAGGVPGDSGVHAGAPRGPTPPPDAVSVGASAVALAADKRERVFGERFRLSDHPASVGEERVAFPRHTEKRHVSRRVSNDSHRVLAALHPFNLDRKSTRLNSSHI